jgi:hypothetical protein
MHAPPRGKGRSPWAGQPLTGWVRWVLVLIAVGLVGVFVLAARIHPYGEDGVALRMATHRQLGLPECGFVTATGLPCPSCGLTTSFALTIRADWYNAARANWVGLLLAVFCLGLIPWGFASALAGRALGVASLDRALLVLISCVFVMLLVRWSFVVCWRQG